MAGTIGRFRVFVFLFFLFSVGTPVFGFTEEQIANFGLTFGVSAFMLYMLFIIGNLAWKAKAGKFGAFVLFLGLGLGMVGFAAKFVIQWILEK